MLKSNAEPCLGTAAGDRFTVIRRAGRLNPVLLQADLTLDEASLKEASGKPTRLKAGKFEEISASTRMGMPLSPSSAMAYALARAIRQPVSGVRCEPDREKPRQKRHLAEASAREPADRLATARWFFAFWPVLAR